MEGGSTFYGKKFYLIKAANELQYLSSLRTRAKALWNQWEHSWRIYQEMDPTLLIFSFPSSVFLFMLICLSLFHYHPITIFINTNQIVTDDQCIQVKTEKYTQMLSVNSEKLNMLICKSYFAETSVTSYLKETSLLENALKHFLHA